MLNINEIKESIHPASFDEFGVIDNLNVESEFSFLDFLDHEKLSDEQFEILNSFSFNTVVTDNYHYFMINNMMLELNQLNYGTKRYDIASEEDLEDALLSCVELDQLSFYEKDEVLDLFIEAVDNFAQKLSDFEKEVEENGAH